MNIESKCCEALESVKGSLTDKEFSDCYDYVCKHNEALLGLEFAIDYLSEEEKMVTSETYMLFEKAFKLMGQDNNSRLDDLKSLLGS